MKRIYQLIFLLFACGNLFAQNIVKYEYWLNNDYVAKVQTDISPTSVFNGQTTLSFPHLDVGFYTLNFRFMDAGGKWSPTHSSSFYKIPDRTLPDNTMTAYEYWLDDNYADRVQVPLASASTVSLSTDIPLNAMDAGIHRFDIRFKDKYGKWSGIDSKYFIKLASSPAENSLTAYEYWLNDDYNEKYTGSIANQQTFVLLDSIDAQKANNVTNEVHFRFKDEKGQWSATASTPFYRPATLSLYLTYTRSVLPGETPVKENGYSNYQDMACDLYNITQDKEINIGIKFPDISLNDPVDVGDEIAITVTSLKNEFKPVQDTIVITENIVIYDTLNIVQNGLIRASCISSGNDADVGIVYDSTGVRVGQFDYIEQLLTTQALPDGIYSLVSMANSPFFNTIQQLQDFASTEMVENTDYILQSLAVNAGVITATSVSIPKLDEERLYYTGNNTSFSVNKSQIAIGNYVTLRAEIDFKEQHLPNISNVKLVVDIPEKSPFVNNSVMIGSEVFNGYSLSNNRLTVPLANDSDIIRFCITPTEWGSFVLNGFLEFTLDGKTIKQPIGVAKFAAESLTILAPSYTAQTTIPVRGLVTPKSSVKVYDNEVLVGQTTANGNGNWSIKCPLHEPGDFSFHEIYAEIFTTQGTNLKTETAEVIFDVDAIEVSKVTMYNTAHRAASLDLQEYASVFDFLNPPLKGDVYWYWPQYPDFTFAIEFADSDPALVSNVYLNVITNAGNIVSVPVDYDGIKQAWIAVLKFADSGNLPVNVNVQYSQQSFNSLITGSLDVSLRSSNVNSLWSQAKGLYNQYKKSPCPKNNEMSIDTEYESISRALGTLPDERYLRFIQMIKDDFHPCGNQSSNNPPAEPVLDPSGYVYEAVTSNRLQDVTTGVYYKTYEEDMYGQVTEKVVLWEAEDYGQINPQLTNEYGEYAWDVPQGLWQVKYEKEGYETVYSAWLPVPPPQLDINVAMVQAVPPQVRKVQGYETGIEILFDKFMLPATMTTDLITVTRNGTDVAGTIALLNAETNPANTGEQFVSKVRFVPETFFSSEEEIILTVKREVQSYTGNEMENDFIQRVEIQKEIKSMTVTPVLDVSLHGSAFLDVSAELGEAAAGRKVMARSVSSVLVSVTGEVTLDASGKAKLQVDGEMPGTTVIVVSLENTDLKAEALIHVTPAPVVTEQVETPVASIPSGSTVDKNTAVTLSSNTAEAIINYTLDNSSPSGTGGLEYIQPIAITEDVIIRAIAVKESMLDSEIAVFEYFVNKSVDINPVNERSITVYTHNQTLYIKGLKAGERYTIYSVLGIVVAQGIADDELEQSTGPLPSKGMYIVSTPRDRIKVLVQ
jgi:hypothetical protein